MTMPLEQSARPMPRLTPGDPVEFAKLPLGAICKFTHLQDDSLWVKLSARKAVALLSKEMATKCPEIVLERIPTHLIVQRYWIGGDGGG